MKKILKLTFIFWLLCSSSSFAEDTNFDFFNSDIFSLAKKKEDAFDSSSSVYVLSSEDIRRSGVTSIPEALRMVPGIQVARTSGNAWSISARGLNHQYASKLLIMIDGITIYTPIFSGTFWDNYDYVLDDIDRIEVIRGPGGSIWGANAMNGIINIITKTSAETQGGYISQIVGNNDNSITEARYGGKLNNGLDTYRIYAKHANREGFYKMNDGRTNIDLTVNNNGSRSNNDGMINSRVGFRYDVSSLKDSSLFVRGDFSRGTSRNYFQGLGQNADKDNISGNILLDWNKTLSKKSNFIFRTYLNFDKNDIQVVDYDERTFDIDFQHFYELNKRNNLIWGLGYRNIQDEINSYATDNGNGLFIPLEYQPRKRNIETYSAFIQDKIGIIPNELYLTIGSKFEHNDQTGIEYQPNARLTYFPARNQTLWAAVSRAIRVPTRGEDSVTIRIAPDLPVTQGNPQSLSEVVNSYELGYRIKPSTSTLFDLSVYYNEYSRLGNFDADISTDIDPLTPGVNGVPTASNTGRATTFGGELTVKWQARDDLRFEIGYDFLKTDIKLNADSNENDDVASIYNADRLVFFENMSPRNQFRLKAFYDLNSKIEIDNMLYFVDGLEGRSAYGITEADIESYVRWDSRLGYFVNRDLELSFGIQNILDDRHNEFSPGLFNNRIEVGRTYYAKAVLQF